MEQYRPPEKEKGADGLTPEQRELAEYYLPKYEEEIIPEQERRDCQQEVAELQDMLAAFEAKHPIDELYAIIDLAVKDAPSNAMRESARVDLEPIATKLDILKKETDISSEKQDELQNRYVYLSKAVGMIDKYSSKVRH